MVRGDPVLQAVGSAGVLGDVAAQGGDRLAGRVRRVHEPVARHGLVELCVDDARLHTRPPVLIVDPEDAVQARELDDHGTVRQRPAGEPGAGAARHERDPGAVQQRDNLLNLLGAVDEDDGSGRRPVGSERVGLERQQIPRLREHVPLAHDAAEFLQQFSGKNRARHGSVRIPWRAR